MALVVPPVVNMFSFFTPAAAIISFPPVPPAAESLPQSAIIPFPPVPPAAESAIIPVPPVPLAIIPFPPVPPAAESLPQSAIIPVPPVPTAVTPSSLTSIATYAERNPQMIVQNARVHPNKSDAQKATSDLRRLAQHEKKTLLATELGEFMERQRNELDDLADRHVTTVEVLEKLLNYTPHYLRKVRDINIENAKIHAKAEEVNAGKLRYPLCCL
jgi:hypothetical protein